MASYKSTVTDRGKEVLTQQLNAGGQLQVVRAISGDGIAAVSPNTLIALVSPLSVDTQVQAKEFIAGSPSILKIPVQVSNRNLEAPVWIREIGIFALDSDSKEFLFAYSWLVGADSDNILPPSAFLEGSERPADTVHLHDVALFVTNQENSTINVQIGAASFTTLTQMMAYAAPANHTQGADTVYESGGESVEKVQRRQDYEIQALKEQLDTGFTGTTITHTFAANQLQYWKGFDGEALLEGVLDVTNNRIYL